MFHVHIHCLLTFICVYLRNPLPSVHGLTFPPFLSPSQQDPENSKELPGYDTIAEATHKIMKECEIYNELGSYILGHVHMKDQWSVVVKYDKC